MFHYKCTININCYKKVSKVKTFKETSVFEKIPINFIVKFACSNSCTVWMFHLSLVSFVSVEINYTKSELLKLTGVDDVYRRPWHTEKTTLLTGYTCLLTAVLGLKMLLHTPMLTTIFVSLLNMDPCTVRLLFLTWGWRRNPTLHDFPFVDCLHLYSRHS